MYESLSQTGKEVAQLIPYLGEDWSSLVLSIALDIAEEDIQAVVFELEDRGLIYRARSGEARAHSVLPLTVEYLQDKWEEDRDLYRIVTERLTDAFASDELDKSVLDLSTKQRVPFLRKRSLEKLSAGEWRAALRLAELGYSYEPTAMFQFLAGYALYKLGRKGPGLKRMEVAHDESSEGTKLEDWCLVELAKAYFAAGGRRAERKAIGLVVDCLHAEKEIPMEVLLRATQCAVHLKQFDSLVDIIGRVDDDPTLLSVFVEMRSLLENANFVREASPQLLAAKLHRLIASDIVEDQVKSDLEKLRADMENRSPRTSLRHQ